MSSPSYNHPFCNHIHLAHIIWKQLVQPHDLVIDATCGRGQDTLQLAKLAVKGKVIAMDIQQEAIQSAMDLLSKELPLTLYQNVSFINQCHSLFPEEIAEGSVTLVVYNLGYLPGGDKTFTTKQTTTLLSLKNALKIVKPGGAVSLTCYPGHSEGEKEYFVLKEFLTALPSHEFIVHYYHALNKLKSPVLHLIQKAPFL